MAEDTTLTPMEVFGAGLALDRMLDEFGDDAVLRSARDKLDRTLQECQRIDPGLADRIKAQQELMVRGRAEAQATKRDERLAALGRPARWGRPMPPPVTEGDDELGYRLGS